MALFLNLKINGCLYLIKCVIKPYQNRTPKLPFIEKINRWLIDDQPRPASCDCPFGRQLLSEVRKWLTCLSIPDLGQNLRCHDFSGSINYH